MRRQFQTICSGLRTRILRKRLRSAVWLGLALLKVTCGVGLAQSWTAVNNGLADRDVRVLAADPVNTSTVYAGGPIGVFKSRDAGASWGRTGLAWLVDTVDNLPLLSTPLTSPSVVARLAIDPANPSKLYAGTVRGDSCSYEV